MQNPIIINDGSGYEVRTAINSALSSMVTLFPGAAAPSPLYPYQVWINNSTNQLMQANMTATSSDAIMDLNSDGTFNFAGISLSQSANNVLAAPNGTAGNPSFRTLVVADISDISSNYYTKTTSDGKYATLGANNNITSITGLTTALSASQGGTGATTAAGATAMIIASLPAHYQRDIMWSSNRTTIISPNNLTININNSGYILTTQQTINLATAASWDSTAINYTVAANRAGKDFYIYACQPSSGTAPMILLSSNSTVPTGYTSTNSRKIGGFHCLCTAVGTISGHTLSGYLAGDILPVSIWDLNFRPVSNPEGMVFDANTNRWVDIYLSSVANSQLVSVNNGVTADGASSPVAFHWYNGSDWIAKAKKNLLSQREFVLASMGSNQGTNIAGNSDPNTTGGHVDTAGQRMISNIGCEDMCGALWQWGSDVGGPYGTAAWKNAFDGNDTGVGGSSYEEPTRGVLGGYWNSGANCGSRASAWNNGPLSLVSYFGLRGRAEPLCGI